MCKLEFTLKQHTPIIHFQHDQDGATLRATEVKPRLDRFILMKLGVGDYEIGRQEAKNKGWLIDDEKGALDYKMKITGNPDNCEKIENDHTNSPMYFGNMGDENPPKHLKFSEILEGTTFSKHYDLCKEISNHIADFFFLNNFGSRQSKGYGSFSVEKYTMNAEEWIFPEVDTTKYLNIEFVKIAESDLKKKYILPFRKIDWFYRSLRSGINYKGLYFKSALFMYLYYQKKTQWDKKTIKAQYFNNTDQSLIEFNKKKQKNIPVNIHYQKTQCFNHNNPDILINPTFQNNQLELKLWRDLFGLSTEESWYSYRASITKKEAFKDVKGRWKAVNKKDTKIERFESPITFKPILKDNIMTVYLLVNQPLVEDLIKNKFKMLIEIKHKGLKYIENGGFNFDDTLKGYDKSSLVLPLPDNFDFSEFLKFAISIDVSKHIKMPKEPDNELIKIKNSLVSIYSELRNQLNSLYL